MKKDRSNHPALNIDKSKIIAKATAFALILVSITLAIIFLILKFK
jgi:hypothetical protein